MKRRTLAFVFAYATLLAACQVDDGMYTVYDAYYQTSFTTDSTNAILGSVAKEDAVVNAPEDEWVQVKGGLEYTDGNVVKYGHCWVKGTGLPLANSDWSNCIVYEGNPGDRDFTSLITGLEHETEYSVRSFIVTSDGTVGYNPKVTVFRTAVPSDKWFASDGFAKAGINAGRYDCVRVETIVDGDTLTFFGMGRAGDNVYSDLWCYSSKKKVYEQVPAITTRTGETMRLWGAVGFGINYTERDIAHHLVYVGCGCTRTGSDLKIADYNQKFFVYDIDTRKWEEVSYYGQEDNVLMKTPFPGQPRTGAVGFSIREWGFVGLGEFQNGSSTAYHSDIYLFMMDKNEQKEYSPTSGYFNQMTDDFGFGGRAGSSVVVVDDMAYIIGGVSASQGVKHYYDDFISCQFTMPINSRPDSYTFTWPKASKVKRFSDQLVDNDGNTVFQPRAFGSAFNVGGVVYYGNGEGYDKDGNEAYFSDMAKFDGNFAICKRYTNEDSEDSRVSRATVVNGGDRAFVVGGAKKGDGEYTTTSTSEWVYRP